MGLTMDSNSAEPSSAQIREVSARAERAGYLLDCDRWSSAEWRLLDAIDGELLYEAETLDEIAHWLGT
ncbi:hypothetical protein [Nocardia miyunensis]|uniref:hypothetical protein n=1 Tax=Nocardia miyunensis TaxID=282684 RepID=UPI00082C270D|nr:hypothetical protein [Nocardia miyunensis]